MSDHVLINDLRFESIIGVLDQERLAPQPLRVDVDMEIDLHDAGSSDDLEQTVHYGEVAVALANLARDTQYLLLERLAQHMAEVVLSFSLVRAVELTLTKLQPPIPEQIDSTAVRIRRVRAEVSNTTRHRAIVALGSNLGRREAHLRFAVERLGESVVAQSQVFETDPVGGPDDQGAYLNMVVVLETELDPYALLRWLHRIEADAGRERVVHWGPRTLDLDLLFFDDVVITGGNLAVPHPRYAERRFVLAPLSEVAPDKCPENWERDLPPDAVHPRGPLG
ncbi:MAG: 2-amino-4-hydroxy-6-hydroxymethyldihydropteridine diphosphokinase [Acidimicrobiia bacterium]|nr:2-amino-4-hydroxy-6-hydroxymethyldihydropteridine diphosphokinase [Acidimicrobiia bacterium]